MASDEARPGRPAPAPDTVSPRLRALIDAPPPLLGPGCVRVRTLCSAVSPGTEGNKIVTGRKSLLGKAHTVMAEGGMAASLAHVDDRDGWTTHFRDTMVGGYRLNTPRMAELHAKEAPARVRELEDWCSYFDRPNHHRFLPLLSGGLLSESDQALGFEKVVRVPFHAR